jgi:hypothetical protein
VVSFDILSFFFRHWIENVIRLVPLFWVRSIDSILFYPLLWVVFFVCLLFIVDIAALIRAIHPSFRVPIVELVVYAERVRVPWSRPMVKFFFGGFVDVTPISVALVPSHRRS